MVMDDGGVEGEAWREDDEGWRVYGEGSRMGWGWAWTEEGEVCRVKDDGGVKDQAWREGGEWCMLKDVDGVEDESRREEGEGCWMDRG